MNAVDWMKVEYDECASLIRNTQSGFEKAITLSFVLNGALAGAAGTLWTHAAQSSHEAQLPQYVSMIFFALLGALINHFFAQATRKVNDTLTVAFSRLCEIERAVSNVAVAVSSPIGATLYHRLRDLEERWRPKKPEVLYLILLMVWLSVAGYVVVGRWVFTQWGLLPVRVPECLTTSIPEILPILA